MAPVKRPDFRPLQAALGGVVGGLAMTALQLLAAGLGVWPMTMEMLLGSMLLESFGPGTWALGFVMHLTAAAVFGVLYGGIFVALRRAGSRLGALIGLLHGLVSGVVLAFIPMIHPLVPEVMAAPGAFLLGQGLGASLGFFLLHVIYGAIVGDLCRRSFGVGLRSTDAPDGRMPAAGGGVSPSAPA